MALIATVTPGRQFVPGEKIDNAKLNQLGSPTVVITGNPVGDAQVTPPMTDFGSSGFAETLRDAGALPVGDLVAGGGVWLDMRFYGAIGDGESHPLSDSFETLGEAQAVFPHAEALDEEQDWAGIQAAMNRAKALILATLGGAGDATAKTLAAFAPSVYLPAGRYVVNRECRVYPHTNVYGAAGQSVIELAADGFVATATPMGFNASTGWIGAYHDDCALLWLEKADAGLIARGVAAAGSALSAICRP